MDEDHLKQAVIELDTGAADIQDAADGGGIGALAIDKIAFGFLTVTDDFQVIALDGGKGFRTLQNIGSMSKRIFQWLGVS